MQLSKRKPEIIISIIFINIFVEIVYVVAYFKLDHVYALNNPFHL